MSNEQNLTPFKLNHQTADEAAERGRLGGIASGEARREKKIIAEMYAKFLEKRYNVNGEDLSGLQLLEHNIKEILSKPSPANLPLMKEVREVIDNDGQSSQTTVVVFDNLFDKV